MNKKVRHVLGISGGKDSAALAIYMKDNYPDLDIEYYCCDTGKELQETYDLIEKLEGYLGKPIIRLRAAEKSSEDPFDHHYNIFGNYLPSSNIRWCTKYLKLHPFEAYVGDDLVVSYVGIRGDEDREGYISKKTNIQSIFPFRKNIWSEDVIRKVLANSNLESLKEISQHLAVDDINKKKFTDIICQPISQSFTLSHKLNLLLNESLKRFNHTIFEFLKLTSYPLAFESSYSLLDNDEILVRDDIFNLLKSSGIGIPAYYEKIEFEVDGNKGEYARSRSGCYFCFFQQKIEWVWLYEQHTELFFQAMDYENEKEGFTWNQNESLKDLMSPARIRDIKLEYLNRNTSKAKSPFLLDILDDAESEGCAACFI